MNLFGQPSRSDLRSDISALTSDLASLARHVTALSTPARRSSYSSWFGSEPSSYENLKSAAASGADTLWRDVSRGVGTLSAEASRRPTLAAVALVGFGVLVGMMARR